MGKLSFSIAINLLTDNFKKGTNTVKSSIRSMQMQFLAFAAALGAGGLGLDGFVSRMIETARETSRAITALKNISGSTAIFADSQKFLIDLAKKYGLEINSLTSNFAKFSASASATGVVMDDQKKIFESLSRAATAYGMSSEDANLMFMAVQQMMSKGKISSEELRRQLGERLPVAMAAMAKAAGVPISQLDKLLKDGKLLSNEVLPKFADALNGMLPDINTDNLETSINRLKNTFTKFVTGSGAAEKYKALIDALTQIVQYGANNIRTIVTYLVAGLLVLITSKLVTKIIGAIKSAEVAARRSAMAAARDAGIAFDRTAWEAQRASASIKVAFTRAMASIKAALISTIPTAIIAAIGALIAKLVDMYNESNRIKNLSKDTMAEINRQTGDMSKINAANTYLNILRDAKKSTKEQEDALKAINSLLGKTGEDKLRNEREVTKEIKRQGEQIVRNAMIAKAADKLAELEEEKRRITEGLYERNRNRGEFGRAIDSFKGEFGSSDLQQGMNSLRAVNKAINDINKSFGKDLALSALNTVTPVTGSEDATKKKTELQKQQESYAEKLSQLNTELELGLKTQNEYNQALGELNINMYSEAKASGDKKVLESEYFKNLKLAAENAVKNKDLAKGLIELDKVQKDYNESVSVAQQQFAKGYYSREELNKKILELSVEAGKSAAGIKGIGDEALGFIAAMKLNASLLQSPIRQKPRDTTFDYKKTAVDIADENLNKAKELADAYKDRAKELGQALSDELANAMASVPSLEDKLKIAQIKQDVKDFTKELNSGLYSGIKDIAGSSDRVVNAFQNLKDVMNNVDSSGWEKIMALWNSMTTVVDSFLSVVELIKNITAITEKLAKAKQVEAAIDTVTTGTKVANAATQTAASATALAAQTATSIASNAAMTTAAKTTMAAESTAAYASIPFFGVGLAAAQIAAMEAMIAAAAIPKFQTGGIFMGGTSHGDKGLARLNKGEMILNMSQQSRLFEAINSGNLSRSGVGVNIGFDRVRGADIYLSLKNYMKINNKKL